MELFPEDVVGVKDAHSFLTLTQNLVDFQGC